MMRPYLLATMLPRDGLGDKERAAQVRVEHQIPVVPGDIERGFANVAAGVVHEDVDLAEMRDGICGHLLDALVIANIECERQDSSAQRFDFGLETSQRSPGRGS